MKYINKPTAPICRIDLQTHNFKVTKFTPHVRSVLINFSKGMGQMGMVRKTFNRFVKAIVRVFAARSKEKTYYRFHRNQYDEFVKYCANWGLNTKQFEVVEHEPFEGEPANFEYIDKRSARDYQEPIINYILEDGHVKIVTLDPGRGKTFIFLQAANKINKRVILVIKAMYIDKWIIDAKVAFKFSKGELITVRGSENLKDLMRLRDLGEDNFKFVICSNKTFNKYIKDFELYGEKTMKDMGYLYMPDEFFGKMGFGVKAVDEVHQELHGNYRQDMYTHIPKTVSLSGTLLSEDSFIEKIFSVMFPKELRYNDKGRKVYLGVEALYYSISNVNQRIRYINPALKSYSHVRFEQSILKDKTLLESYGSMIFDVVQKRFIDKRKKRQKCLVYFSTVEMCTHMTAKLKKIHPTLNVVRYVSEDDYEDMLEGDLIVSTLKSLGTAIDIPGLVLALMTDALSSLQANLQAAGRLRDLQDWPDQTPEFLYLVCSDIDKHIDYHRKKKDIFTGRVVYHKETMLHVEL